MFFCQRFRCNLGYYFHMLSQIGFTHPYLQWREKTKYPLTYKHTPQKETTNYLYQINIPPCMPFCLTCWADSSDRVTISFAPAMKARAEATTWTAPFCLMISSAASMKWGRREGEIESKDLQNKTRAWVCRENGGRRVKMKVLSNSLAQLHLLC